MPHFSAYKILSMSMSFYDTQQLLSIIESKIIVVRHEVVQSHGMVLFTDHEWRRISKAY